MISCSTAQLAPQHSSDNLLPTGHLTSFPASLTLPDLTMGMEHSGKNKSLNDINAKARPLAHNKKKEMFYLTTHSTHFIYGYMASDIW